MTAIARSLIATIVLSLVPLLAAAGTVELRGHLVDVTWLEANRGRADVLVLDASPAQLYAARHIPGAISADVMTYGTPDTPPAEMERFFASWGVTPQKTVIITDMGGSYLAARLFFALAYHGFPERQLALLDGGLRSRPPLHPNDTTPRFAVRGTSWTATRYREASSLSRF